MANKRKYGRTAAALTGTKPAATVAAEITDPFRLKSGAPVPQPGKMNAKIVLLSDIEVDRTWNARSGDWDNLSPDAKDSDAENSFHDLVQSVRDKGVEDPIELRPNPNARSKRPYALVCGFRRYRAAEIVGLESVPALIGDMTESEAQERNIVENMARKGLKQADACFAVARLFRQLGNVTDQAVANRLALSNGYVAKLRKIGNLPTEITTAWREGRAPVTVSEMNTLAQEHAKDPSKTAESFAELVKPSGASGGGTDDPHAKLKAEAKALGIKLGMLEFLDAISHESNVEWDEVIGAVIVPPNAKLSDPKETSEAGKAKSYAKALTAIATAFAEGVDEGKKLMADRQEEEKEETVAQK